MSKRSRNIRSMNARKRWLVHRLRRRRIMGALLILFILAAGAVTKLLREDPDPVSLLRRVMPDFDLEILETSPIAYRCYCSRDRMARALISLGAKELRALIDEQGQAELTCRFCDNVQHFTREELEALLLQATRP